MADVLRSTALILFGMAAGVCLVTQATLNGSLRAALGSWAWAGLASYVGGTLVMAVLLLVRREVAPGSEVWSTAPALTWAGGLI